MIQSGKWEISMALTTFEPIKDKIRQFCWGWLSYNTCKIPTTRDFNTCICMQVLYDYSLKVPQTELCNATYLNAVLNN